MDDYCFKKYKPNAIKIKEKVKKYGVAIVPEVLDKDEIENVKNGVWDYLEHITQNYDNPIDRNNDKTWKEGFKSLFGLHSMLIQHWGIGHAQFNWDLRQNPKVVDIFSKIWDVNKHNLVTSFDGASVHFPHEITKVGSYRGNDWFHCDQSFQRNNAECIQSWITAYDVNEGDATLAFLEKSNQYHGDAAKDLNITEKGDWYKLNQEEIDYYINKGCKKKYIKCPAGSMVFWDSRTIHCGREPRKERKEPNFRFVSYICMMPKENIQKKIIDKRIKAFEELRTTTHWANNIKLFPKNPRTYGRELPNVVQVEKPILTKLGLSLVGY